MKKIILKEVSGIKYKELLLAILGSPSGDRGMSVAEVRQSVKAMDAIESSSNEFVLLEDAVWEFVRTKVENAPYLKASKEVVDFIDSVVNAETPTTSGE